MQDNYDDFVKKYYKFKRKKDFGTCCAVAHSLATLLSGDQPIVGAAITLAVINVAIKKKCVKFI